MFLVVMFFTFNSCNEDLDVSLVKTNSENLMQDYSVFERSLAGCNNNIAFLVGNNLITEEEYSNSFYRLLNDAYESNPIEFYCNCDCTMASEIQNIVNRHHNSFSNLSFPIHDFECNDLMKSIGTKCSNSLEDQEALIWFKLDEMTNGDVELMSEEVVELIVAPLINDILIDVKNIDFCYYKGLFNDNQENFSDFTRISTAQTIMHMEIITTYYNGLIPMVADMNDDDVQELSPAKALSALFGAYWGAIQWATTGPLYGEEGQDCLGSGAGWGADGGAIGGL